MKTVKIGLIGLGTIGMGVFRLLQQNGGLIAEKTGVKIEIALACDNKPEVLRSLGGGVGIAKDWQQVTSAPDIDTVVELIGGLRPAADIALSAMKNGKNLVTANKKLLAENGAEIFGAAGDAAGALMFEAAVGGGIPCLLALNEGMAANRILSVKGILNGTTNYILSQMEEKGLPFAQALKDAQDKGFAEADPTFDIEGYDAGHKICLLAALAGGRLVDYTRISIEGISKISDLDIKYAKDMGYVIRLLGIAKISDDVVDISVHPVMLPALHPLASVRNEFNAVMIDGDMTGPIILYGKGAGALPTASAVVSDILRIAKGGRNPQISCDASALRFASPEKRVSGYYLRMYTKDRPGILAKISGILGSHSISIASLIQREAEDEGFVPLILTTHSVDEASIMRAASEINKADFLKEDVFIIRIED